jgi:hypothetical protein
MNVFRHLQFIRSPENEDGTPEPEPVVENALAGEVVPEPEPEPEPQPEPVHEHGNKGKVPWYMQRIHENQNKADRLQVELDKERREKAEALALIDRQAPEGQRTPPAPRTDAPDFESAVEARAAAKLLFKDSTDVRLAGQKEFADFGDSLAILTAVGATSDEFVGDVIDTDKDTAHKMFDFLAKNPERAAQLVNMPSRRRVAELTRISMSEIAKPVAKEAAPAPKPAPVSKVPAPKPVLEAAGGVEEVDEDKMSDAQWSAWRKKQLAKKFG